jgi:hypothetical protein
MSTLTIRPVKDKADTMAFLKAAFPIFADDPHWVAPLFLERLEHLDPKKNPYFEHAEAQLFIAERNGKPVGRISAQVDRLHLERHQDQTGQFGFIDAEDNPETFAALFNAAEDWLRAKGMKRAMGPFSFSINDETGLLIDGFNTPPNMMMPHHRSYYAAHVESSGYSKTKDLLAFEFDNRAGLTPTLRKMVDRMMASGDLKVRPVNKKDLRNEINVIMSIFNDAWSENWGFIPFTEAELNLLAKNFKMLVPANAVQIASWKGENAAFIVSMPNINEWFQGLDGRVLSWKLPRLIKSVITRKSKSVRVPLMGVLKKYQDTMVGAGLALSVIREASDYQISRGVTHGEFSWVLEDNLRLRHIMESMGARAYKTYRVYEKAL